MNSRFILVNILLLAVVIALAQYTFQPLVKSAWPHWGLHLLFGWLLVASVLGYHLVESKMKAKPKDFVNTFMLISGLRMFASVLIVVFLVLQLPETGKYVSIYYVGAYLLFLVVEVMFLFRRSKQI